MARRGSYAKGVAKREEILERALEVIAREGYRGASVKEIADAVGLSQAGLLHYFDSKEELFVAILRKRDELDGIRVGADTSLDDARDGFLRVIRHNTEVPGLVELFSRMAVEAGDPRHPAHAYFRERHAALRAELLAHAAQIRTTPPMDPDSLVRIIQAVADGLQLQWMLDRDVDMPRIVADLFDALDAREERHG